MAVKHDEDFLLSDTIDTTHGDIDVVVAVDEIHAWHIGCQHFLQIAGTTVLNHLSGDERGGHGYLGKTLSLTGGSGDGGCHAGLDIVHNVSKLRRVTGRRTVVGILLQHQYSVTLRLLDVVTGQVAKCNETECVLSQIAMKRAKILQQHVASLLYATYLVVTLSL